METKKTKKTRGLGKGLNALFENAGSERADLEEKEVLTPIKGEKIEEEGGEKVVSMKIRDIEPNPEQPRKNFDEEKLVALADSLKNHGMVQPILVKKSDNGMYVIIAGERRWRAAKLAGLREVPCIVKEYDSRELMEVALIENLQREDLNPIEEAEGYHSLMETFSLTQEQVSERVGKSRSAVANSLRLNKLCGKVKEAVISGELSAGHARTLLGLENEEFQPAVAERILKNGLNVRQTEKLVADVNQNGGLTEKEKTPRDTSYDKYYEEVEDTLSKKFGTKVKIQNGKSKGKIEIEYYSREEFERLLCELK